MDKQYLKQKIFEAVKNDSLGKDIKKVSLFGSYLNGTASDDSDVDIIVEFNPLAKIGFFKLVRLQRNLGSFIGKRVDILTPQSLSKFFREKTLKEAEIIYER